MFARLSVIAAAAVTAFPVWAAPVDDLINVLGVAQIVDVMRTEGLDYGDELARDLLPGGKSAAWSAVVSSIYDTDSMYEIVRAKFSESMGDQDVAPLLEYFATQDGQRVVALELEARQAMMEGDVEDVARATFRDLDGTGDPRLGQLETFVEANDLIESNVAGALNASFHFYTGLLDGGAIDLSEAEIIADVWEQEDETRQDTREWLYGFLLLAYGPLSDETLDDYIDISSSEEGRVMNRALFAGFNKMYDEISHRLGLASARQMQAQDL
ncbi:DUF2059 domain-containing protein [Puniceibacterium sediminis]|uniref:DUF2059 domain-containing protein n=1 Tax=Puniceibacterium sediminis TaxID=1608407 RepID=A0A238XRB1_9RHOB|nr:DUF2059 domain-containing protein [Puniceibacterium sediminis]SNR61576.1 hypothetical protein SAMN06265370_112144 [Puniceibacterium sediminis]